MWGALLKVGSKLLFKKGGGFSFIKIVALLCVISISGLVGLAFAVVGGTGLSSAGLSGKVQLVPMDDVEQKQLEQETGKWLAPYGDYMADPPTSSYNNNVYSSLQNLKVENVAVPFDGNYIYQLQTIGNPIEFLSSQHVTLSFGLIKAIDVLTNVHPDESIPILQPKNLTFKNVNIDVTAKVIVRYEPQSPYYRQTDDNGNPVLTHYTVKTGDTIDALASYYHMTVDQVATLNNLYVNQPEKDSNGNVVLDANGNPVMNKTINFQVGMNLVFNGEYYTPPDKAIYETQTFSYPVSVPSTIDTYNGKHNFSYTTNTINQDIKTANSPDKQNRKVDADGQKETLTIQMPVFSNDNYNEDYTIINNLLSENGASSDDEQLLVYRQALAYDPMFSDSKANSALAQEIMDELGQLGDSDFNVTPISQLSGVYCGQVPQEYFQIYKDAGQKYNIPWVILASVHKIESNFGTINPMVSSVGAVGQMQFMPSTWLGWNYPNHTQAGNITDGTDITNVQLIAKFGGIGLDADGDGKADPYNPKDAIFTASKYLASNGGSTDIAGALKHYNNADWYVNEVLQTAQQIAGGSSSCSSGGSPDVVTNSQTIKNAISYAYTLVGNTHYVFGAGRTPDSRALGNYDCSSFVWWAYYKGGGVDLNGGCTADGYCGVSTRTLDQKGTKVAYSDIQVGDLVFFDTGDGADSHVGIYIGNDQFINCEDSYGVHINKLQGNTYWWQAFNNGGQHVQRLVTN